MNKLTWFIGLAAFAFGCTTQETVSNEQTRSETSENQTDAPTKEDEQPQDFPQSIDPGLPPEKVEKVASLPEGKPIVRSCYDNETVSFMGAQSPPIPNSAPPTTAGAVPPSSSGIGTKERRAGSSGPKGGSIPPSISTGSQGPSGMMDGGASKPPTPPPPETDNQPTSKPSADVAWGQDFFLSNDDSMSLASAQRVLFALEQNRRISSSQIRPHELLNYFSFETTPVPTESVFSVAGGALKVADQTLSVALSVKGSSPKPQPLDLTIVVDRSGSMSSEGRMDYTKRALSLLTQSLNRGDRLDIVLFDSDVCTPLEDWVAGRDKPALLEQAIKDMQPRGSTDLDMGLREGYRIATKRGNPDDRNQRVMLITDAFLNTGNVDKDLLADVGKLYEEQGIRLTGVGVGRDFNDSMLNKLTEKGKGAYVYLGSEKVVDRLFGVGFGSLTQTIAHDVRFQLSLPDSLAMERFYGEEASTVAEDVQPIHYFAGTSQLFLQDLTIHPDGLQSSDSLTLTVHYKDPASDEEQTEERTFTVGSLLDSHSANVRKGRALMAFSDALLAKSMTGTCGKEAKEYGIQANDLSEDQEIAEISRLLSKACGVQLDVPTTFVSLKLKLDSDEPVSHVNLRCGDHVQEQQLQQGVSSLTLKAQPGPCRVSLDTTVTMHANIQVPSTDTQIRCQIRAGRMGCSS